MGRSSTIRTLTNNQRYDNFEYNKAKIWKLSINERVNDEINENIVANTEITFFFCLYFSPFPHTTHFNKMTFKYFE